MTIRSRLTLLYTGVLSAVLVIFGAIVYVLLFASLTRQVEDSLQRTADDILRASLVQIAGVPLSTLQLELDLTANVFVQVFDPDGNLIQQTMKLEMMDNAFDVEALKAVVPVFTTVEIEDGKLRVLTVPLRGSQLDEPIVGYLQLAASLSTVDRAREMLLLILIGVGIIAVGISAMAVWVTAGTVLRPIDEVTETALRITRADDLSLRIPQTGPSNDEVGRLISAFNETLERLENLFETQRRFLADVSHELRTPLTAIRGNVDLIRRMGEADPISLDAITAEVDRMTRLVRDLLLLVQAETGKLPLAREIVEMDTLLLEVYQQAKILANDKIQVNLGEMDQARVLGDRDKLKQVILNLVANALEHTPPAGSVIMGLACVKEYARVTVSDSGPGIPKEELPHIFERFYRVDPSRKRKDKGGAGLGLSIAYWIARSHNGRIEVASEVAKGTTFSVWLPLIEENHNNQTSEG
ncbi:MAG: HAMP domain-containing protein [Anaerolineales bacterium]|nr:HAMP domain-containing protein [Anaerolineales bacterium]